MDCGIIRMFLIAFCVHVCTAQVVIDVSATSEGDIVLTCSVDGAFEALVQWSTNRTGSLMNITGGDDFSHLEVLPNRTLIIRTSEGPYYGFYFCTHPASGRNYTARLKQAPALRISRIPLGNGHLLLTCLVNQSTTVPVTWSFRRSGETTSSNLVGGDDDDHVQVLSNNSLIVRDFEDEDVGHYTCTARHDGLVRNKTARVSLAAKRDIITFTTYQDDNYNFFVTCIVEGAPATPIHQVTWSYGEDGDDDMPDLMPSGDEDSHVQVLENSTLLIRDYTPEDAGWYYCTALLSDGTRKMKPIDVGGAPLSTVANIWLIIVLTVFTIIRNASAL
ncbi:hemicentin-2-like [Lytechinus pictus]|uniref:hemicentin-2-like n=1 Tax=Lytechinus pictus TaxID=7653 RepID=UPI0030B9FF5A